MTESVSVEWNGAEAKAAARAGAARGLNQAAEQLWAMAVPLTPYLDGDLTKHSGAYHTTPDELASQVQYDTDYAVIQHERLDFNHTRSQHPGAQAKYLEAPLLEYRDALMEVVAAQMRAGL